MDHDYHQRQYDQCYDTTRRLLEFIDDTVGDVGNRQILDVACGGGSNVHHMLNRWRESKVTGVDLDGGLLDYARTRIAPENAPRCDYKQVDLFELPALYGSGAGFDITTLMQTLLLFDLDHYPEVLRSLMQVTREWIFLSSLFTDKRMDVSSQIRDYTRFGDDSKEYISYNTLCMDRFRRVAAQLGAREVIFRDFEISVDLTGPAAGGLGTYTTKIEDGRRLQFSGAVFMPWKLAALRLR